MQRQWSPEAWARLGARIRTERERRGLTRQQFADLAGVSIGSIRTAEGGTPPKGRWPTTFSKVEQALGWAPDSMRAILDGGEPITESATDNATPAAAGVPYVSGVRTPDELPRAIREVLPYVLSFGELCRDYGASEWMVAGFNGTVSMMIDSVTQKAANGSASGPRMFELSRVSVEIGLALRGARDAAGLTLGDVHERTGLPISTLETMEAGGSVLYKGARNVPAWITEMAQAAGADPAPLLAKYHDVMQGEGPKREVAHNAER